MDTKQKYLIALPAFKGSKGWNHQTILVSATSETEAIAIAKTKRPHSNIGSIKIVNY